jgi:urease accessory protein UreF
MGMTKADVMGMGMSPRQMGMSSGGHLYMQANEVKNAVIHYHRPANGTLTEVERLEPAVLASADEAMTATLDDLGSAAVMVDLASMAHETQCTRLLRS